MKKHGLLLPLVLIVSGISSASIVHAAPRIIIDPVGRCTVFDGNGEITNTVNGKIATIRSPDGNIILSCTAQVAPAANGKSAQYDNVVTGGVCGIANPFGYALAERWRETVSVSGEAILSCQGKK